MPVSSITSVTSGFTWGAVEDMGEFLACHTRHPSGAFLRKGGMLEMRQSVEGMNRPLPELRI
jgi:hypothetical protein